MEESFEDEKFSEQSTSMTVDAKSSNSKLNVCKFCHVVFPEEEALNNHISEQHNNFCEICGHLANSQKLLITHLFLEHKVRNKCEVCEKAFSTRKHLDNHKTIHNVECKKCNEVFDDKDAKDTHDKQEHPVIKCSLCKYYFIGKKIFDDHMKMMHPGNKNCDICSKIFRNQRLLDDHMKMHLRVPKFKCKLSNCAQTFYSLESLKSHEYSVHSLMEIQEKFDTNLDKEASKIKPITTVSLPCKQCNLRFKCKDNLRVHIARAHSHYLGSTPNHNCKRCNRIFVSNAALVKHNLTTHDLTCDHCHKIFSDKQYLDEHISSEHTKATEDEEQFKCDKFPETFENETSLSEHVKEKHTSESFHCKFCDEHFHDRKELGNHYKEFYPNFKMYACEKCPKNFHFQHVLFNHIKKFHDSEGKYEFSDCKEHFLDSEDIKNYIDPSCFKNNEGTVRNYRYRYICKRCDRIFINSKALATHNSTTHDLTCEHCPKVFADKRYLDEHVFQLHSKDLEKQLKCDKCPEIFENETSLTEHVKKDHTMIDLETFHCKFCDEYFADRQHLANHYKEFYPNFTMYSCKKCHQNFHFQQVLFDHMRECYDSVEQYEYDVRKDSFLDFDDLKNYFDSPGCVRNKKESNGVAAVEKTDFQCKFCNEYFSTANNLNNHYKEFYHTSSTLYRCAKCPINFQSKESLYDHVRNHHAEEPKKLYKCHICFQDGTDTSITEHYKSVHPEWKCSVRNSNIIVKRTCENVPKTLKLTSPVIKTYGKVATTPNVVIPDPKETSEIFPRPFIFKCFESDCYMVFNSKRDLKTHSLSHYKKPKKVFQCKYCKEKFPDGKVLALHYKEFFPRVTVHHCTACEKIFHFENLLKDHVTEEHKSEYVCHICCKTFRLVDSLKEHYEYMHPDHGPRTEHKCKDCGKLLRTKFLLENHTKTHLENPEKPFDEISLIQANDDDGADGKYKCKLCPETFDSPGGLDCHKKSHFVCEICDIVFKSRTCLMEHYKDHSQRTKNVRCPHCTQNFRTKACLISHMTEMHHVVKFSCYVCSKDFSSLAEYNYHMETHDKFTVENESLDKEKSPEPEIKIEPTKYQCNKCTEDFDSFQDLELHEKDHIASSSRRLESPYSIDDFESLRELQSHVEDRLGSIRELDEKDHSQNISIAPNESSESEDEGLQELKSHVEDRLGSFQEFDKKEILETTTIHDSSDSQDEFEGLQELRSHVEDRLGLLDSIKVEPTIQCSKCSENFGSYYELELHDKDHHDNNAVEITSLDSPENVFENLDELECHVKNRIGILQGDVGKVKDEPGTYKCAQCSIKFENLRELQQHEDDHIENDSIDDVISIISGSSGQPGLQELESHVRNRIGVLESDLISRDKSASTSVEQIEMYECSECSRIFESLQDLETHAEYHTEIVEADDNTMEGSMISSLDIKSEVVNYECGECSRIFTNLEELEYHGKEHIKMFENDLQIVVESMVNSSSSRHSTAEPRKKIGKYECIDCSEIFKSFEELEQHRNGDSSISECSNLFQTKGLS